MNPKLEDRKFSYIPSISAACCLEEDTLVLLCERKLTRGKPTVESALLDKVAFSIWWKSVSAGGKAGSWPLRPRLLLLNIIGASPFFQSCVTDIDWVCDSGGGWRKVFWLLVFFLILNMTFIHCVKWVYVCLAENKGRRKNKRMHWFIPQRKSLLIL